MTIQPYKRKIIIDTDPGIDDAIAIALALFSEEIEVKLISTVAGNVGINYVTENALKLVSFFRKEVAVARGATGPLVRQSKDASSIHGKTGLEGYAFEEWNERLLVDQHAVNAIYQAIMASEEKTTLLAIGPLTNIALLLKLYPQIENQIEEIIIMGGSIDRGNYNVYAEFNIGYDPEAAKIVFDSAIKKTMVGLNIGLKALIKPEASEEIKIMNKVGDMFYSLFKKYRGGSFEEGLTMFDSTAVAYLLRPDLFTVVDTYVDIELTGQHTTGATLVDFNGHISNEANTTVCIDIDEAGFNKWFLESIRHMDI